MSIEMIIAFIIGALVGVAFGVWWEKRRAPDMLFDDPEEVSDAVEASRVAIAERTKKRFDRIMEAAEKEGKITNDGVEDLFCISDRTASTYLRRLTNAGRLERHGTGRGTYYTPTKN